MKRILTAATAMAVLTISPSLAHSQEHGHEMPAGAAAGHAAPAKPPMSEGCKGRMPMAPAGHGAMGPPAGHGGMGPPNSMSSRAAREGGMGMDCDGTMEKGAGSMSMGGHGMKTGKDNATPMQHGTIPAPKATAPKMPVEGS